jgi:hypothetical protein
MQPFQNMLLISGTGRNVGKTLLAARIIRQFSHFTSVVCVKVCPHRHAPTDSVEIIASHPAYMLGVETSRTNGKDTARFLVAGATTCYYVESEDKYLPEVFQTIMLRHPADQVYVIESGGLRRHVIPGLHIRVTDGSGMDEKGEESTPPYDLLVVGAGEDPLCPVPGLKIVDNQWVIKSYEL